MAQLAEGTHKQPKRTAHAGYRVNTEPSPHRIRAVFNDETVADSSEVVIMRETRLAPVFYFPREDVRMDLLVRTDRRTNCPFKGNASYWTLNVGENVAENAAWSYEDPFDEASSVKAYIAFDWRTIDAWFSDDNELETQPRDDTPVTPNPFIEWLVQEAWKARSAPALVAQLAEALVATDIPLWRLRLLIRTLNPQLFAINYTWQRDTDEITEFHATHAGI